MLCRSALIRSTPSLTLNSLSWSYSGSPPTTHTQKKSNSYTQVFLACENANSLFLFLESQHPKSNTFVADDRSIMRSWWLARWNGPEPIIQSVFPSTLSINQRWENWFQNPKLKLPFRVEIPGQREGGIGNSVTEKISNFPYTERLICGNKNSSCKIFLKIWCFFRIIIVTHRPEGP